MMKVAIEGLPRAGKTTQVAACVRSLSAMGFSVRTVGKPGGLRYSGVTWALNLPWLPAVARRLLMRKKHSMFLRWRLDSLSEERRCDYLICDRFALSTLAFAETFDVHVPHLEQLLLDRAREAVVIFLRVPPRAALRRIADTGKRLPQDVLGRMMDLDRAFMSALEMFPHSAVLDGTKAREEITVQIMSLVLQKRAIHKDQEHVQVSAM